MTFREFLKDLEDEDSPAGDLANDVASDRRLKNVVLTPENLRTHLIFAGVDQEVLNALDEVKRRFAPGEYDDSEDDSEDDEDRVS